MFGAFGKSLTAGSLVFVSKAAVAAGLRDKLGVEKQLVAVEHTRDINKKSMVHNHATPDIEVDPETYEVLADGELADLRAGGGAADGATLFSVLMNPDALARIRAVRRASRVFRAGAWDGSKAVDRVVLDADERFRRRRPFSPAKAEAVLRSICRKPLRCSDGHALALDDGALVAVIAKPERWWRLRRRTRRLWPDSPGISATATPSWKFFTTGCACDAIMCLSRCSPGSGRGSFCARAVRAGARRLCARGRARRRCQPRRLIGRT